MESGNANGENDSLVNEVPPTSRSRQHSPVKQRELMKAEDNYESDDSLEGHTVREVPQPAGKFPTSSKQISIPKNWFFY